MLGQLVQTILQWRASMGAPQAVHVRVRACPMGTGFDEAGARG